MLQVDAPLQAPLAEARQAFEAGRSEEALENYAALLAARPAWIEANFGYQDVLVSLDRENEVRAFYARLLEAGESSWKLLLHGRLLHDAAAEEQLYRRALELEPGSFHLHVALSSALRRQGRHLETLAAIRLGLELRPDDFELNAAHIAELVALEAQAECLAYYRGRLRGTPDELAPRLCLALALFRFGQEVGARQELDACLAQDPEHVPALYVQLVQHVRSRD